MKDIDYKSMILFMLLVLLSFFLFGLSVVKVQQELSSQWFQSLFDDNKTTHVVYKQPMEKIILGVTATAYTSHPEQTDSTPNIAAWGDTLSPGMSIIAVSRDLLDVFGLDRGSKVKIHGLPGHYLVLDKMNKRWKKKIDIYMGMDKRAAFKWGKQQVTIEWASSSGALDKKMRHPTMVYK